MESITDTILVSLDLKKDVNNAVLVVGRKKPNKPVEIINAFQGDEALELYKRLTRRKDDSGESNEN